MVKPDESSVAHDRDQMVDRLIDLLGEASVISKNVKIGIVDYIVGMAILEVSEHTRMIGPSGR